MDMLDFDKLTSDQEERLREFFAVTLTMNETEWKAVDGMIPMTQELFDSIVDKCGSDDLDRFFLDFASKYPDFLKAHTEKIEAELKEHLSTENWHEPTPEEDRAAWEKLCVRIRAKYGEDAI